MQSSNLNPQAQLLTRIKGMTQKVYPASPETADQNARKSRPDVPRPYRTVGYPFVPAFYILAATVILVVLFMYRPSTTWPGLLIVLLGMPIYLMIRKAGRARPAHDLLPEPQISKAQNER